MISASDLNLIEAEMMGPGGPTAAVRVHVSSRFESLFIRFIDQYRRYDLTTRGLKLILWVPLGEVDDVALTLHRVASLDPSPTTRRIASADLARLPSRRTTSTLVAA